MPLALIEVGTPDYELLVCFCDAGVDFLHLVGELVGGHVVVSVVEALDMVELFTADDIVDPLLLLLDREVIRDAFVGHSRHPQASLAFEVLKSFKYFPLLLYDLRDALLQLLLAIQDLVELFLVLNPVHIVVLQVIHDHPLVEVTVLHGSVEPLEALIDRVLVL